MPEDPNEDQNHLTKHQQPLDGTGLSRRSFIERLAGLGVGVTAALVLGVRDADAGKSVDAGVRDPRTSPAADESPAAAREAPSGDRPEELPADGLTDFAQGNF